MLGEIQSKVSGRPYSQMVERSYEDIADFMADLGEWTSFRDQVAELVDGARAYLRSRDLPDCPQMVKSRSTGEWQCYEGNAASEISGGCDLDQYILKLCQLERDSFEHLAARVIVAAVDMERPERERAIEGAIQFGRLSVLTRVYYTMSQQGKKKGGASKRRKWADLLVKQIDSWEDIPESTSPLEIDELNYNWKIFRDGDVVVCKIEDDKGTRTQTLKRSSFEKRYLRPALRKRGHKQS